MTSTRALTGGELTPADVWAVAVDGRPAPELTEAARQEMDAARADYRFVAYPGARHGFTNPEADTSGKKFGIPLGYDPEADRRSWQDMQELFARVFG